MDIGEERQFCLLSFIFWPQLQISSNNKYISSFFIFPQIFNRMFGCYICMYIVSDQGIYQLGAKLYAEEPFLLGIDWSLYSTVWCIGQIEASTSPLRAFYTFVVPERREFDYQSLPGCGEFDPHAKGVGNLNRSLDFMWNLWALCTWRAIMAGTQCTSNVDCILTDWQVNEVNIVVKYS